MAVTTATRTVFVRRAQRVKADAALFVKVVNRTFGGLLFPVPVHFAHGTLALKALAVAVPASVRVDLFFRWY